MVCGNGCCVAAVVKGIIKTLMYMFERLCKEEGSYLVSAITEWRDMGMYEVPLSMSLLGFGI